MSERLDPQALFAALAEAGIAYVAIGGTAVNAHGVPRTTFDVDVIVDRSPATYARLAELADVLGAPETVQDAATFLELDPRDPVDLARGSVVRIPTRFGTLDLVNAAPGAPPFADLDARAIDIDVDGVTVRVAGLDDLIAMKRASARPKDLGDVEDLLRPLP